MELFKLLGKITLEGTKEAESQLENLKSKFASGAKAIGKSIAGISVAGVGIATAIGAASVKVGSAFESQMSTVKSISGATAEEFEMLKEKAKEMGAATSFSATESAQAFEYMAMAGWDAQQMSDGLAGVMNLAAASGEDLASASDIVTDAMTAFGMKAEESEYFSDVLAKTASSANTNVSMMGETFKYVAPLAGAMGYSIEDMSVAIGLMANSGIKGSQSGTSLRNIITNLATPTDDVASAMESLGISLTDNDGNVKSFGETLGDLRESFSQLDEVERANYASTIAGKEGMSGFLALINASEDDFDKLSEQIENCSGAAKEMADIRLDNLSGDVTLFKSALEGAGIEISEQLSPMLRDLTQKATSAIPKIADKIIPVLKKLSDFVSGKLLPIVEKVWSLTEEYILPVLSDVGEIFMPLIEESLETIGELIETLFPIIKDIYDFIEPALTFVMDIVTDIVGILPDAVNFLLDIVDPLHLIHEEVIKLSDKQKKLIDKSKELSECYEENIKKTEENVKQIDNEYYHYDSLLRQLDNVVDKNGKIKVGYEDRATAILTTLSEATGVEFEIVDGEIQKYDKLKSSIEDVITQMRTKAKLEAYEKAYKDAAADESAARETYEGLKAEYTSEKNVLQSYYDAVEKLQSGSISYNDLQAMSVTSFDWNDATSKSNAINATISVFEDKIAELEPAVKLLGDEYKNEGQHLSDIISLMENYELASVETSEETLLLLETNFKKAEQMTEEQALAQVEMFEKMYDDYEKEVKKGTAGYTKSHLDGLSSLRTQARIEYSKFNGDVNSFMDDIVNTVDGKNAAFGESGYKLGFKFTSEMQRAIAENQAAVIQAAMDIANGISSISPNVKINSPSDLIYYSTPKPNPDIVGHAKGGIVTREHIARVGEDGAEAIIPLEKNTEWIDRVAERMSGSTSNSAVAAKLDELISLLKNQKIYLDGKTLVGGISGEMDKKLGSMARFKRRGANA